MNTTNSIARGTVNCPNCGGMFERLGNTFPKRKVCQFCDTEFDIIYTDTDRENIRMYEEEERKQAELEAKLKLEKERKEAEKKAAELRKACTQRASAWHRRYNDLFNQRVKERRKKCLVAVPVTAVIAFVVLMVAGIADCMGLGMFALVSGVITIVALLTTAMCARKDIHLMGSTSIEVTAELGFDEKGIITKDKSRTVGSWSSI